MIGIMQRLHEGDLAARMIELGWTHLCLEAEAESRKTITFPMSSRTIEREEGDLLWPTREGKEQVEAMKLSLGSYAYAAQYQQRPAPKGGGMFQREWFQVVQAPPSETTGWLRFWDLGGTTDGDYSVGVRMGRVKNGPFVISNIVRGRWTPLDRDNRIVTTAEMDGVETAVWLEEEGGSAGKSQVAYLILALVGFTAKSERPTGDKVTRAEPFAAQCEAGNVMIVRGPWNESFFDEAEMFPAGKHDDQVDSASGAFNKLATRPRPIQAYSIPALPPGPIRSSLAVPDTIVPNALAGTSGTYK
jgi:predicted phage terminase large subunit-like protein